MADLTGRLKILCLDFDGVACVALPHADKFDPTDISQPPVPGLYAFLAEAVEVFEVNILSARSSQPGGREAMIKWFIQHAPDQDAMQVVSRLVFPTEKPPTFVGLDDRVMLFEGRWPHVRDLVNFKTWTERAMGASTP